MWKKAFFMVKITLFESFLVKNISTNMLNVTKYFLFEIYLNNKTKDKTIFLIW